MTRLYPFDPRNATGMITKKMSSNKLLLLAVAGCRKCLFDKNDNFPYDSKDNLETNLENIGGATFNRRG